MIKLTNDERQKRQNYILWCDPDGQDTFFCHIADCDKMLQYSETPYKIMYNMKIWWECLDHMIFSKTVNFELSVLNVQWDWFSKRERINSFENFTLCICCWLFVFFLRSYYSPKTNMCLNLSMSHQCLMSNLMIRIIVVELQWYT